MKKIVIFLFIAALLVGTVSAQNRDNRQRDDNLVTVDGTLKLERGFVAVESGDSVYFVPMLNRYIGFINGLSEGTRVSVEGRNFRNVIQLTKLTINGRDYDFAAGRGPDFGAPGFDRRQENGPDRRQFGQSRNNSRPERRNFSQPSRRYGPGRSGCCR